MNHSTKGKENVDFASVIIIQVKAMADRLSIDRKYAGLAKGTYKNEDILLVYEEKSAQTSLFLIALALGVHEGKRTQSNVKEGLILEQAFNNYDMAKAFVYSVAIQELHKQKRDNEISNTDVVYQIAEEYANTGFEKLEEMISENGKFDEESLELDLIEMMDEVYEDIKNSSPSPASI